VSALLKEIKNLFKSDRIFLNKAIFITLNQLDNNAKKLSQDIEPGKQIDEADLIIDIVTQINDLHKCYNLLLSLQSMLRQLFHARSTNGFYCDDIEKIITTISSLMNNPTNTGASFLLSDSLLETLSGEIALIKTRLLSLGLDHVTNGPSNIDFKELIANIGSWLKERDNLVGTLEDIMWNQITDGLAEPDENGGATEIDIESANEIVHQLVNRVIEFLI
jgi:hypothetical protein